MSQIHICICVKDTLYIHIYKFVREFLATKGITTVFYYDRTKEWVHECL